MNHQRITIMLDGLKRRAQRTERGNERERESKSRKEIERKHKMIHEQNDIQIR